MNPAAVLEGVLEESSRGWSVKEQSFCVVDRELPPSSRASLSVTTDRKGKFRIDSLPTNFDWRTGMRVAKTAIDLETEPFRLEAPGKYQCRLVLNVETDDDGKAQQSLRLEDIRRDE